MNDGSCYGCPDRYPGCHDECKRYAIWKAEYAKQAEWLKRQNSYDEHVAVMGERKERIRRDMAKKGRKI